MRSEKGSGDAGRSKLFLKKGIAETLLVVSAMLTALVALYFALVVISPVNGMLLAFLTSFQVRNDSTEHLRFWVAGTGESGRLGLLPVYSSTGPVALRGSRTAGYPIAPGESVKVNYDWDDYNFTTIIVERPGGELLAVDTDRRLSTCCYRHSLDQYSIPPLQVLRRATVEEREALTRGRRGRPMWQWVVLASPVTTALLIAYLHRLRRRLSRIEAAALAAVPGGR